MVQLGGWNPTAKYLLGVMPASIVVEVGGVTYPGLDDGVDGAVTTPIGSKVPT